MITYRLLKCVHNSLVDAAPNRPGPVGSPVDQSRKALGFVPLPLALDGPRRYFLAGGDQFGGLRFLSLCQRKDRWIVLRPRRGLWPGIRIGASKNLHDVS